MAASRAVRRRGLRALGVALLAVGTALPIAATPAVPADGAPVTVGDTAVASPLTLGVEAQPHPVTAAGQAITFTFTVTAGPGAIGSLTVDASLGPVTLPAASITCATDSLAASAETTCSAPYTATQDDVDAGAIRVVARATGTDAGNAVVHSRRAAVDVPVTQAPALTVAGQAAPTSVDRVGHHVSYSFTVKNSGNTTLRAIAATAAPTPASDPVPALSCSDAKLAPGADTACTGSATASAADFDAGALAMTATATAVAPDGSAVTDKSPTVKVTANPHPALSVVKQATVTDVDGDGTIDPGDTVSWTFTVTDTGNVSIHGLTVDDPKAGTVTCPDDSLAAGADELCTADDPYLVSQADVDAGHVSNTATAAGLDPSGAPVTSRPARADTSIAAVAHITLDEDVQPSTADRAGDTVTYTFTVTDDGNVTVDQLAVADTSSGAGAPVAAKCPTRQLAPGAHTVCTATYRLVQADVDAGTVDDTATASATDPDGNPVSSGQTTGHVAIPAAPALSISDTPSPTSVAHVGAAVHYTFHVVDTGNVTVTALAIADQLSAPAGPALDPITCAATSLGPGVGTNCTATYLVTQADLDNGGIRDSATASGSDPAGGQVTSAAASGQVVAVQTAQLKLVESVSPHTVSAVGDSLGYTFKVVNDGNVTVSGLTIADTLAAPAGPALDPIDCPATALAPGDTTSCTATYSVTQADLDNGAITDSATADASGPTGDPVASNETTGSVGVDRSPELTLAVAPDPLTVTGAGQTITYTFTVTNAGNVTVGKLGVALTGTAPAGPFDAPICPTDPLPPSGIATCSVTYAVSQADVDNGAVALTATASGTDPTGAPVTSAQADARVAAAQQPALTLQKSAKPQTVSAVGDQVTYSFAVTNSGNVTITGVSIADSLSAPAGPVLNPITCPDTTLVPDQSTTCTATYVTRQSDLDNGSIDNSATALGQDPTGGDVQSAPSTASVAALQAAALNLVKSALPQVVTHPGQQVTYRFAVTNSGNVTVHDLSIADTLQTPAGPPLDPIDCPLTTLPAGATTTCVASYTVTQDDIDHGSVDNSATASGLDPGGAQVTSGASEATVTVNQSAGLRLVKRAQPVVVHAAGQTVGYTFTVTNTGNVTVDDLAIDDTLSPPAGPALAAIDCPTRTLAPKDTTTCTATYTVSQADMNNGGIANSATATGTDPGGQPVVSAPATAEVSAPAAPGLTVAKTAQPDTVTAIGQLVTYSFLVTNTGNVTLSGIAVTDTFIAPAGPELSPTCPVTSLDPGDSTTCTAEYPVTAADFDNGRVRDSAVAAGTPPVGPAVDSKPSAATVTATPLPALTLVKSAAVVDVDKDGVTDLGDRIAWTFSVTNSGNLTLEDVTVADPVAGRVVCPPGALPAGQTVTCTAADPFVIRQIDVDAGHVDNTATASGIADRTGEQVTSPPSSTRTPVGGHGGLGLVKAGQVRDVNGNGSVDAGDQVGWTFTVVNTGTVTVRNLSVIDLSAGPISCVSTVLAPNATTTCTANDPHTLTLADIEAGSLSNTATSTGFAPGGDPVTSPPSTAVVSLPSRPALNLAGRSDVNDANGDGRPDAGDTITWEFVVDNAGNVTISALAVLDRTVGAVTCPHTTLAPGATMSCRSRARRITAADMALGQIASGAATATGSAAGQTIRSPFASAVLTLSGGGATGTSGGGFPIAFTGARSLPGLAWLATWALLAGLLFTIAGRSRRRPDSR